MYHIKKYFGKLNKRQAEEIGTLKSPTKPLYLTKQKVEELSLKKEELERLIPKKEEIQADIENYKKEIKQEEEMLKVLQDMDFLSNNTELEREKIKLHINAKEDLKKSKEKLQKELDEIKPVIKNKKVSKLFLIIPALFILISVMLLLVNLYIFGAINALFSFISFIIIFLVNIKQNNNYKKNKENANNLKQYIKNKIELIENAIQEKEKTIKEEEQKIELNIRIKRENIKLKYPDLANINIENKVNISEQQNYINNLKLDLTRKDIELKRLNENLENLSKIEEELNTSKEAFYEIIEHDKVINIAKNALDIAYLKMKESITPRFTKNLSYLVDNITNGKYKNIKVNEESELVLEIENRKLY